MTESVETRRSASAAAAAGLLYVVFVFESAVVGGTSGADRHSLHASASDVADLVAGADPTRVWIGEFGAMLGYALSSGSPRTRGTRSAPAPTGGAIERSSDPPWCTSRSPQPERPVSHP